MKKYIGVKQIEAEPMMLNDAEEVLQRKIQNQNEPGYLVKYPDGYQSWSPKEVFEEAYRETDGMTFGLAIEAAKKGHKISRAGWNGKSQYIELASAISYKNPAGEEINTDHAAIGNKAFAFCGTSGVQMGWLASQADMLAEDWAIVE
jgi:hypothetical protein